MLPDDVLLDIFDFYVDKDFEEWITLAHVCRRWRSVVFQSPHRLNLRLVCTHKTRVRDTLDVVWPSLPLIIRHAENIKDGPSCVDNTIAALERNDRVCQIGLDCLRSSLEYVTNSAMQKPFPELTDLHLSMVDNSGPILRIPDSFLGGTAPRLRSLDLSNVLFPGLPKLLLIATRLVNINLDLYSIPRSGYITPEAIATSLSALTSLESLCLLFRYPQSRLALESRRPPPPPLTRSILPSLTKIRFKGTSKYLEEILARSDAPRLNEFHITFFNQIIFDTPQLFQFISRRPTLRALTEGRITFSSRAIVVRFTSRISDRRVLSVKIPCDASEWQLSSLEQVCTPSLPPLSALEDLYIFEDGAFARRWQGGIENTLWLDLLRSFVAVKNFYLSDKFVPRIAPALQELFGGRTTEVLPALEKIFLVGFQLSGPLHKDIEKFVAARRLTGHPVAVSRQKQSGELDYPVLLNNLLQGHRNGNLTPHFQYVMTGEGLDGNVTHFATAKCEHSAIERNAWLFN